MLLKQRAFQVLQLRDGICLQHEPLQLGCSTEIIDLSGLWGFWLFRASGNNMMSQVNSIWAELMFIRRPSQSCCRTDLPCKRIPFQNLHEKIWKDWKESMDSTIKSAWCSSLKVTGCSDDLRTKFESRITIASCQDTETSWLKPSKFSMPKAPKRHYWFHIRHHQWTLYTCLSLIGILRTIWFFERSSHRKLQPKHEAH